VSQREQETTHDRLRTQEGGTKEELPVQPRTNDGRAEVLLILLAQFHTVLLIQGWFLHVSILGVAPRKSFIVFSPCSWWSLFACEHCWCVTIAIITTSQVLIKKGVGEVTMFTHKQEMHAWVLKMKMVYPRGKLS